MHYLQEWSNFSTPNSVRSHIHALSPSKLDQGVAGEAVAKLPLEVSRGPQGSNTQKNRDEEDGNGGHECLGIWRSEFSTGQLRSRIEDWCIG